MTHAVDEIRNEALRRLALFTGFMAVLLFAPAGTLDYWQAWVYLLLFIGLSIASTLYFIKHDPALVRRRMQVGVRAETEKSQKLIMALTSVCFLLLILLPGFDRRLHWSSVPAWLSLAADLGLMLGFAVICVVMQVNSYAATTIRVDEAQPVVSHGPYALVRHPMYAGAVVLFGCTPLALGSYWALLVAPAFVLLLAWRLIEEERYLKQHLPGYADYCRRVRYRLVPGVW
jgi:protein-S-isoprenylcysteine O-methyltransferase Ste14